MAPVFGVQWGKRGRRKETRFTLVTPLKMNCSKVMSTVPNVWSELYWKQSTLGACWAHNYT